MITDRFITDQDYSTLELSLAMDEFHSETKPEFFYDKGALTKVYEDEQGPILFLRGTKSLRIDVQFMDNENTERNIECMMSQFDELAQKAKANGFTEIVFCTDNRALEIFCRKRFKFEKVSGELRKFI